MTRKLLKKLLRIFWLLTALIILQITANAQIVLLGDNAPYDNVNDGDFKLVKANWRQGKQSPFWKTYEADESKTETYHGTKYKIALHNGTLFGINQKEVAESIVLNTNPDYQYPKAGDVLKWSFGADLEYISKGSISLSLVFGEHERMLAEKVKLKGSDKIVEHFKGTYTLSEEDAEAGHPKVRATFYCEDEIKVFLHYVNLSVVDHDKAGPQLHAKVVKKGIQLNWTDSLANKDSKFYVYRQSDEKVAFKKLGETTNFTFSDITQINGKKYTYLVTRLDKKESGASNKVKMAKIDDVPPAPPTNLKAEVYDAEIRISWTPSIDKDTKCYLVFRGYENGKELKQIANNITKNTYLDFTPVKDVENDYVVVAEDFSGNKSAFSLPLKAKVRMVNGASFSDLILPMPIHKKLTSNAWGAEAVLPRDVDNGIEDPEWSYWGGRPVKDMDGKYHMNVTRWPANSTKGHWEWPRSTVAYVLAEKPTGPYKVVRDVAYNFADGLGHNPDVILLNNGNYMLYSLINWEPTLFVAEKMSGPWIRLGVMTYNKNTDLEKPERFYRFERNLSGVQMDDGRFLFVTKGGAMMISEGTDPLGPYTVKTLPVQGNPIIPEKYRNSNYEDPVLWKDEVQYHMMINAFWDYRCIYLRSPDGINWKFNPGTAYTPNSTSYEDGTQTHWYKLERPHVLTDEYGRATHLSLAVIDVPKADDLARDKHSSKNIVLPLIVHKRLSMLNKEKVTAKSMSIKVIIHSEEGFDAQNDLDIESLRFGACEEVDYGRGCKVIKTKKKGKDLLLEFDGKGNGISEENFAAKLLGKTKSGELIIGFSSLSARYSPDPKQCANSH